MTAPSDAATAIRVLMAIDESPVSLQAARVAARLLRPDREVIALNVARLAVPWVAPEVGYGAVYPFGADHLDTRIGMSDEEVASRAHLAGFDHVEAVGDVGDPAASIVEAAAAHAVHVVVVGAHERGPLSRLVSGSVSEEVVRHRSAPVLVVPESEAEAEIVTRDSPVTVAVAVDLDETAETVVRTAARLFGPSAHYVLVHATHPDEAPPAAPSPERTGPRVAATPGWEPGRPEPFAAYVDEAAQAFLERLRAGTRIDADTVVELGDPVEALGEVADLHGADVVVVGSTGKGWLARLFGGSISQRVLREAAIPVLVV